MSINDGPIEHLFLVSGFWTNDKDYRGVKGEEVPRDFFSFEGISASVQRNWDSATWRWCLYKEGMRVIAAGVDSASKEDARAEVMEAIRSVVSMQEVVRSDEKE